MEIESLEFEICQEIYEYVHDRITQEESVNYIGIANRICLTFTDKESARLWSQKIQSEEFQIGVQSQRNPFCCGNYFEVA